MNLRDVAEWLADTINQTGLLAYPEIRAKANFPCAMVGWPAGEYDADLDGGDTVVFPVHLLASANDDLAARHLFDNMLSRGTPESLKDILEAADPDVADSVRVTGWEILDGVTVNDVPAYGMSIAIEVIG